MTRAQLFILAALLLGVVVYGLLRLRAPHWHRWRFVRGSFNVYEACATCAARRVILGQGGYQPIDRDWLFQFRPELADESGLIVGRVITVEPQRNRAGKAVAS